VVLLDGRSTAREKHHRGCTTPCRPWAAIRHVSGVAGLSVRRPGCGGTWRGPTHMKMAIPTEPACEHVWIHIAGPRDPGGPTDTEDIAATAAGPTVGQSLPLSTVLIKRGGQWFVFITVGGMGVDPRNTWTCALASLAPKQNIRQQGFGPRRVDSVAGQFTSLVPNNTYYPTHALPPSATFVTVACRDTRYRAFAILRRLQTTAPPPLFIPAGGPNLFLFPTHDTQVIHPHPSLYILRTTPRLLSLRPAHLPNQESYGTVIGQYLHQPPAVPLKQQLIRADITGLRTTANLT
jgi:hypothetical protein